MEMNSLYILARSSRYTQPRRENETLPLVYGDCSGGGSGGVCGGANLKPRLYVDLYDAAVAGRHDRVAELHRQVMDISGSIYQAGRHPSRYLKGLKCALDCLGICSDFMAEPFHRFRAEERAKIVEALQRLGVSLKE